MCIVYHLKHVLTLELVGTLSNEQLEFELQYLKSLGFDIALRSQVSTFKAASITRELNKHFTKQTSDDFNKSVATCDLIIDSFSYLVEQAQNEINKLYVPAGAPCSPVTGTPAVPTSLDDVLPSMVRTELPKSVCY